MMTRRTSARLGLFCVLLGSAAACTDSRDGPIDFQVTGGFTGHGDGTPALHIELDGTATRAFPDGGHDTAVLDPGTVADLRQKIRQADFDSLEPAYGGCCDDFVYSVSVVLDSAPRTVNANKHADMPATLRTVIDTLDDINRRSTWQ
jgi:hypothetical protein